MSMGGGQSTTTTTQELSPEQRALIEPVIPIAKNYLKNPPKQYKGSAIAGFDPLQKEAQQMTMSAADQMLPITGQTGNNYLKGLAGYDQLRQQQQFLTSGDVLRADSNPYLQGAIEAASRPTIQQFQQQILPGIQNESINSGAYGGTRQGIASGIAGQAATQSLADIASKMSNENYQAGLGAMVQGQQNANQTLAGRSDLLQNQSNILQQSLLPAQLKESVGAQQQMMKQQLLSEKVQKFVNGQMIPFSVAQDVAQMAFGMPGGTTKSVSDQPGNPMMGMQMGMGALGMLPMMLGKSDRRLKDETRVIYTLSDGLNVYEYRYIGTDNRVVGLMADEVEELYPDAVTVTSHGYKTVKYEQVPSWRLN